MARDVQLEQLGAQIRVDEQERQEEVEEACFAAALEGMPIVVEDTPSDRGQARAAWDVDRVPGGADLFNDAPYAGALEAGSRPHRPPFEPILRWVVRKFGLKMQNKSSSKRGFEDLGDVPEETRAVAWAVCEKIAQEGTEGNWMVRDNLPKLERILKREVEKRLRQSE